MDRQRDTTQLKSTWQIIRGHLEEKKRQIYADITKYPPPIPACDQQFNHLLEQRARVLGELAHLDKLCKESNVDIDPIKQLDEFIEISSFMNHEEQKRVRAHLAQSQAS